MHALFSSVESSRIDMGDFISHPSWDTREGYDTNAWNATKSELLRICLQDCGLDRASAIALLRALDCPRHVEISSI